MAWDTREIDYEHYRRFDQLLELHKLTQAWIGELNSVGKDRASHALDRGLSRELTDRLFMLDSLGRGGLSALVDDTSTTDVLIRLERTAWSLQAYTLAKLEERTQDPESSASLRSVLEQTSWKLGRDYANKRWPELRDATRRNISQLILTLNDTPFGNGPTHSTHLLPIRVTEQEACFEMLQCPHQQAFNEVSAVADALCNLHSHWLKGFAYGLNPAITVDATLRTNGEGRCRHRWHLSELRTSQTRPTLLDHSVSR
jgi:hypothetical protein